MSLMSLRSLEEDFPVLSAKPLTFFVAAPYGNSVPPFTNGTLWQAHDSVTGAVAGTSSSRNLVKTSGVPSPTVGSAVNGRVSAVYDPAAVDFSIATLNLSLWTRSGNYNSGTSTWSGTASAGTSGSFSLVQQGANPTPTDGATLNGRNTVSFARASSQRLSNASAISTILTASAYSGWALINNNSSDTAGTIAGSDGNDAIFADAGSFWHITTSLTNGGVAQSAHWDGASFKGAEQTLTNSTWSLLQFYYDGTNTYFRVNSGTWQVGPTQGSITDVTGLLLVGCNWNGVAFFDGLMADLAIAPQVFTNPQTTFDSIKTELNTFHGLSL